MSQTPQPVTTAAAPTATTPEAATTNTTTAAPAPTTTTTTAAPANAATATPDTEAQQGGNEGGEAAILPDSSKPTEEFKNDDPTLQPANGADFRIAPREHGGVAVMAIYNVLSFISFVFMLCVSCPIPVYRSSIGQKWTIWKDDTKTRWSKTKCDHKKQIFQAIEAFSIVSCIFCLAAFLAGMVHMFGKGHYGVTVMMGLMSMITTLVVWALMVHQYHKYNCPGEPVYANRVARLHSGFALAFISFAFMFIACLAVLCYLFAYFALDEFTRPLFHPHALVCALLFGACLVLCVVGSAFTMFENNYSAHKIKFTLWHVELIHTDTGLSEYWSIGDYHCSKMRSLFRAGRAFILMSCATLYITFLFALGAVYQRLHMKIAFGFGWVTFLFLLIGWAIMVGARYKNFCPKGVTKALTDGTRNIPNGLNVEHHVQFYGYTITEGLGMLIAAWCATPFILIYLYVVG